MSMMQLMMARARMNHQTGTGGDPYWSSVVALLHMEGPDNSTTFTDQKGTLWTPTGAKIKTAKSRFGSSSAYFDGSSWLRRLGALDTNFSGDYTIECFVNYDVIGTSYRGAVGCWGDGSNSFILGNLTGQGLLDVMFTVGSGGTVVAGNWYHLAYTRQGDTHRLFLDGVLVASFTNTGRFPTGGIPVTLGAAGPTYSTSCITGYVDEVRITNGVARYTASFTPSTTPFPDHG